MEIEIFTEVGNSRPSFVYYVDGKKAGPRVEDVLRTVGNTVAKDVVRLACKQAKWDGFCKIDGAFISGVESLR
jgi:hypothetical protein